MQSHETGQVPVLSHLLVNGIGYFLGFIPFGNVGLNFGVDPCPDFGSQGLVSFIVVGGMILPRLSAGVKAINVIAIRFGTTMGRHMGLGRRMGPLTLLPPLPACPALAPQSPIRLVALQPLSWVVVSLVAWEEQPVSWCPESRLAAGPCIS